MKIAFNTVVESGSMADDKGYNDAVINMEFTTSNTQSRSIVTNSRDETQTSNAVSSKQIKYDGTINLKIALS